jgi:predicted transposase/invertase (TIGR01784 family)
MLNGLLENELETARLDALEEGRKEGIEQGKLEVARNLRAVLDDAGIASATGLSVITVTTLRQSQHD